MFTPLDEINALSFTHWLQVDVDLKFTSWIKWFMAEREESVHWALPLNSSLSLPLPMPADER